MEPGNRTTAGRSGTTCQGGREAGIAAGVMWSGLDEVGTTATTLTPTCANPSTPLSSATAGSVGPSNGNCAWLSGCPQTTARPVDPSQRAVPLGRDHVGAMARRRDPTPRRCAGSRDQVFSDLVLGNGRWTHSPRCIRQDTTSLRSPGRPDIPRQAGKTKVRQAEQVPGRCPYTGPELSYAHYRFQRFLAWKCWQAGAGVGRSSRT